MKKILIALTLLLFPVFSYATTQDDVGGVWVNGGNLYLNSDVNITYPFSIEKYSGTSTFIDGNNIWAINFQNGYGLSVNDGFAGVTPGDITLQGLFLIHANANTGALKMQGGNVTLLGVYIGNNTITGTLVSGGAANMANSAILNINSSTIYENTANWKGGGIYANHSSIYMSGNVLFRDNQASYGGGLYIDNGSAVTSSGSLTFRNNTASYNGGALYVNNSTVNLTGFTNDFDSNIANDGGGIYTNGGTVNISNGSFTDNRANLSGGAINMRGGTNMTLSGGSVFQNNTANSGGAVTVSGTMLDSTYLNITGSENIFRNNIASSIGGAMYISNSEAYGGDVTLENTSFLNNTAGDDGGAIYLDLGILNFIQTDTAKNSVFSGNKANGVSNALFIKNGASAIFNTNANTTVEMRDGITSGGAGSPALLNKTGLGTFELYGNMGAYTGNVTIDNGLFAVKSGAAFRANNLNLVKVNASDRPVFDLQNESTDAVALSTLTTGADSLIKMDVGANADRINVSGAAMLDGGLDVLAGVGTHSGQTYTLIDASSLTGNLITDINSGNPALATLTLGNSMQGNLQYAFEVIGNEIFLNILAGQVASNFSSLSGLTFNQSQMANAFDAASLNPSADAAYVIDQIALLNDDGQRVALAQSSGYFLANVLGNPLYSNSRREIFDRIKDQCPQGKCSNGGLWAQAAGYNSQADSDSNSLGKYKENGFGGAFGWDNSIYDSGVIWGLYGKYLQGNISQGQNSGDVSSFSGGIYGGLDREIFDLSAVFSLGFNQYKTERYIPFASRTAKADFNAVNSVIDLESGYKMDLGNSVLFRPFAGIVGNAVIYSGFNETGADFLNLHVNGDTLFTSAAKAGAKLFYDSNIYNVYGGAELRYLLSGNTPEISSTFEGQDAAFNSKGDERDRMMYGLNLGAEFKTSDNCRIFANLSSFISNGYTDYSWNAGIRYAFPNIYPR